MSKAQYVAAAVALLLVFGTGAYPPSPSTSGASVMAADAHAETLFAGFERAPRRELFAGQRAVRTSLEPPPQDYAVHTPGDRAEAGRESAPAFHPKRPPPRSSAHDSDPAH